MPTFYFRRAGVLHRLLALTIVINAGLRISIGLASAASCSPTQSDYLGPYYVSGMPVLKNINRFGKPGEPLIVSGLVRSTAGKQEAIANARLEVWQTDGQGAYHPAGQGNKSDYADSKLDMRGTVVTNASGRFSFRTVVPGAYRPRPPHFHYRITAPGYKTLITQHYVREAGRKSGVSCRSAEIDQSAKPALFPAPTIFLQTE